MPLFFFLPRYRPDFAIPSWNFSVVDGSSYSSGYFPRQMWVTAPFFIGDLRKLLCNSLFSFYKPVSRQMLSRIRAAVAFPGFFLLFPPSFGFSGESWNWEGSPPVNEIWLCFFFPKKPPGFPLEAFPYYSLIHRTYSFPPPPPFFFCSSLSYV